jgi:hypothetical protein
MQNRPPAFRVYLVFLAVAVVAYWQVAFLQNSLKWDVIDCYLPWRYHVGECLQNGIFPFWNPYTHGGYPIHADLRSVWYPEALIIGLVSGYSNLHLHLLFIVYLSLAGLGVYLLSSHFTQDWRASLLAGAVYLLSGFFTGHGQEMFGIIAATWIPFVLHYFIRLLKYRQVADVLRTALFSFLLVTGGYQALWAILLYLLLALLLAWIIQLLRQGKRREVVQLIKLSLLLVTLTALSLTVIAVSYFQVAPHLGRLSGVSLSDAWFMPFSPRSALSFLVPFATVKDAAWYDTDFSMSNAYVGLIVLVFFIFSLFRKRNLLLNVFLISGLVSLLASFGKYTPVREILFHTLPLMDLFRHSSFFSYFAVLAIVLSAAVGFSGFFENPATLRRNILRIALVAAAGLLVLLFYGLYQLGSGAFLFFGKAGTFQEWLMQPTRYEHLVVHSVIQLVFLTLFIVVIYSVKRRLVAAVLLLVLVEMTAAVQLNTYYTVVSPGVRPLDLASSLRQRAPGFPLPVADAPVSANTDAASSYGVLWRNTSIFSKVVSFGGFNSFRLQGCVTLADSLPQLAETVIQNPVLYFSDTLIPFSGNRNFADVADPTALVVEKDLLSAVPAALDRTPGDSLRLNSFYPGYASAEIQVHRPVALTLLQAWYPGWEVFTDGKKTPVFISNRMFMSIVCNPGSHKIEFVYRNRMIVVAFVISYLTILLILTWLVLLAFRGRKQWTAALVALVWLLPLAAFLLRFYPGSAYDSRQEAAYREAAGLICNSGAKLAFINADNEFRMKQALSEAGFKGEAVFYNLARSADLNLLLGNMDTVEMKSIGQLARVRLFAPVSPEEEALFSSWDETGGKKLRKAGLFSLLKRGNDGGGYKTTNDFEQPVPGWNGHTDALDTLHAFSGRYANRIDRNTPGSASFRLKCSEGEWPGSPGEPFTALAKVRLSGNAEGASLILQQRRGDQVVETFSLPLTGFSVDQNRWVQVAKAGDFRSGFRQDDELLVFIWGSEQTQLYADDFCVQILPDLTR